MTNVVERSDALDQQNTTVQERRLSSSQAVAGWTRSKAEDTYALGTSGARAESAASRENRADIARLEEENASLRAYLDRVLALLDSEADHSPATPTDVSSTPVAQQVAGPSHGDHATAPVKEQTQRPSRTATTEAPLYAAQTNEPLQPSSAAAQIQLRDLERRLRRTEETVQDLMWAISEHQAVLGQS